MNFSFDPLRGLVVVRVELSGPKGSAVLSLALDTGATSTLVNQSRLMQLGYDPAAHSDRLQITTGSGVEFVPCITIDKLTALGQDRHDFPVLSHNLPPSASIDGLLGLDFLRGQELTIDFRNGRLRLA